MAINTKYKVTKGSPESLLSVAKISDKDLPLIQRLELDTAFTPSGNRIDVFFYALDGRFLSSIVDSKNYSVIRGGSTEGGIIEDITLNPQKDSIDAGYVNGDVNVLYNFVNNLLSEKNAQPKLFIESISPDRTEIRALTNDVSTRRLIGFIDNAKARLNDSSYFEDFRLNFGRNNLPIGINLDRVPFRDTQAVIIKLYEPLPASIQVKDTFLLEELVGDSVLYQVETEVSSTAEDASKALRGPNYNIELVEENNNPTGYLSYNELFSYPVTNSYYEVYSLFNEKGAQLSIDHTDFSDFIHFSSAEERLRNFYYKASLLESYRNQIDARNTYTGSIDESIRGIINNFDHYDRYLYFETGSTAWPKSTTIRPYRLQSTGSSEVQTWYTDQLNSASLYDAQNNDRLINSIPSFIREDTNNAPYALFVDMVGQHFDNLWIYMKGVTSKYDADNRLDFGISKDLVREAVEGFGVTLYNNNEALENLFAAFTGETYDSGSEQISSLIVAVEGSGSLTGSIGNEHLQPMPKSSYQKEVYKRIYHNIPLLTKSKGTERGLRALINSFGIPSDVLKIRTFGGQDTTATPFYGPSTEVTSSLGKIRVSNTDAVVTGSTLSNYTSVVNYGDDYSKDLHTVEIGFSPTDNLDSYIKSHPSMSAFDLDSYIGDPGYAYSGSYSGLSTLAETVFTSGSAYTGVYNAFDFVRLIKFFDNSIFRIIKDFVPARSNIDTGIIIKPHILDRSKIKQPEVKWSNQSSPKFTHSNTNLDFTGSYYSSNFSIDGEIDTAFITGSTGLGLVDSGSYSYTETYANPSGGFQTLTRNYHDQAAYTGELSGSIVKASNGELNRLNLFKKGSSNSYSFKYYPSTQYNNLTEFVTSGYPLYPPSYTINDEDGDTGLNVEVFNLSPFNFAFRFFIDDVEASPGVPETGSVTLPYSENLRPGDTLDISVDIDFYELDPSISVPPGGFLTRYTAEIISGSTTVATNTIQRESLNSFTEPQRKILTTSYTNTSNSTIDAGDFTVKLTHHSFYSRTSGPQDLDAITYINANKIPFNNDEIGLWITEGVKGNYSSSFIEALAIPKVSDTNGDLTTILESAEELVFQFIKFSEAEKYDSSTVNYEVEGSISNATVNIGTNFINLTHQSSAPYSASFSASLDDLTDGSVLQLDITSEFTSYYAAYLNYPFNLSNTPYITASIRNKNTEIVTGSLEYTIQQGLYPNTNRSVISYRNDTGTTLSDLEFYYQVNIPDSRQSGLPVVNLKNISIKYEEASTGFYKSGVLTKKELNNFYYYKLQDTIELPSSSLTLDAPTTEYYTVGFLPGINELFRFNDYAATSNNVDSLRKSNIRLIVDEKTYTPTQGTYKNFFLPANYSVLLGAINNGVEGLDERLFAEVQDSNYYSTGWVNGRYGGTEATNLVGGFAVLGKEPALTFETFNASLFDTTSTATEIKTKFSGSETKEGDLEVYYNTYTLQGEETLTLSNVSSVETNGTAGTVNSTTYEVDISNAAIGSGTYSGSIGNLNKNDRINIDFSVLIENSIDLDISSVTVNIKEPGNTVPIVNQSYNGAEFVLDYTVNKVFTFDSIPRNISDGILEFSFTNIEDDEGGSPNFTLTVNSIKKVSLQPFAFGQDNIVTSTSSGRTIFYSKQLPTPSSPSGYIPVINSKIYRFSNNTVYTTNDKGIVTNIE